MRDYFKLIRVRHYVKNILVFSALACSGQLFDHEKLISGAIAFVAFCMISSVVYIVNDVRDCEKDRMHPTKCQRPIASGKIKVKQALRLAAVMLVIAILCNALIFSISATLIFILYFILNIAYSFKLKNIPIVDITILVSGFLIRVLYGALVTDIVISNWLYLTVIALSFYFAMGKRRNELKYIGEGETRYVLKAYSIEFLDKSMGMCLTLANVFYALWSMDEKIIDSYNNYMVFTVPIVLLITMKYSLDVEGESDGDPVEVLLSDKVLLALCTLYLAVMFMIIYL